MRFRVQIESWRSQNLEAEVDLAVVIRLHPLPPLPNLGLFDSCGFWSGWSWFWSFPTPARWVRVPLAKSTSWGDVGDGGSPAQGLNPNQAPATRPIAQPNPPSDVYILPLPILIQTSWDPTPARDLQPSLCHVHPARIFAVDQFRILRWKANGKTNLMISKHLKIGRLQPEKLRNMFEWIQKIKKSRTIVFDFPFSFRCSFAFTNFSKLPRIDIERLLQYTRILVKRRQYTMPIYAIMFIYDIYN